jgi:hypothetical protein
VLFRTRPTLHRDFEEICSAESGHLKTHIFGPASTHKQSNWTEFLVPTPPYSSYQHLATPLSVVWD